MSDNSTIQCPACAEEILAQAKKCKHCGEWLADKPAPTVIEQTGKGYKGAMAIGAVVAMLGTFIAYAGGDGSGAFGVTLLFMGIAVFIFARIGAWWNHA